jgi:hypothetical protein
MRTALAFVLAAGALIGLGAREARAITLEIVPAVQDVALGGPVEVAIAISGLGDQAAPSLGTFDVDVTFDLGILSFGGVTFGDPVLGDQLDLFGLGSVTTTTPGSGLVNLFELSLDLPSKLDALQAGAFTLATLSFVAVGIGSTPIGLALNALGDAEGASLDAQTTAGTARVAGDAGVAEPSALILFGLGIVGLTLVRRRLRPRRR